MTQNSPDPASEARRHHQALAILRAMASDAWMGRANDHVLGDYLDAIALGGSRSEIRSAVMRLEELGLVRNTAVEEYLIAILTEQGERVASGNLRVEGVARLIRE